jgi:hypothetical protein
VIATSDAVDVRDFAGVVVCGPSLTNSDAQGIDVALILEAEAYAHGVPVIVPQSASHAAACDGCGQYQTIATVRSKHGEPFCAACLGNAPGCFHCFTTDEPTMPVYVNGGWEPQCMGCARITRVLTPSEWNPVLDDEAEQPRTLFGITA